MRVFFAYAAKKSSTSTFATQKATRMFFVSMTEFKKRFYKIGLRCYYDARPLLINIQFSL